MNFDRDIKRRYEVLLGCSTGHVSPFLMKPSNEGKLLIQLDRSILDSINFFENKYQEIVNFFKNDDDCKAAYNNIIHSIIEGDAIGVVINHRYLMEIHQRIVLFNPIADNNYEKVEEEWSDVKGSILYKFFIGENTKGKTRKIEEWFHSATDKIKNFFSTIQEGIKELKSEYQELGNQLHYFERDRKKYRDAPKRRWTINEARDFFVNFLGTASEIKKMKEEAEKNG